MMMKIIKMMIVLLRLPEIDSRAFDSNRLRPRIDGVEVSHNMEK